MDSVSVINTGPASTDEGGEAGYANAVKRLEDRVVAVRVRRRDVAVRPSCLLRRMHAAAPPSAVAAADRGARRAGAARRLFAREGRVRGPPAAGHERRLL
jgi:hypothetical protein